MEFVDHVGLACAEWEGCVHSMGCGKLVVAFVSRVALDVEHYVEESLFGFRCISHNWEYCSRLPELSKL